MGTLSSELKLFVAESRSRHRAYTPTPTSRIGVVEFMRAVLEWDVLFVLEHDELRRAPDTSTIRWRSNWVERS